jgi:putative restriction endonuclease
VINVLLNKYFDLKNTVRPKDFINDLRKTLPSKYSPLQSNGDGLQGVYLASVPIEMAEVLLGKIGTEAAGVIKSKSSCLVNKDDINEIEGNNIEELIRKNLSLDETEKEAIIKARRGQGVFRQNLEAIESRCRVTKVTNPNHLIAGHIKPWAKCKDNSERLDGHNGLLLAPHIDHLFDKGYISFLDNGDLVISPFADLKALAQLGVQVEQPVNLGSFTGKQKLYLTYHRDFVLKK